MGLGGINRIAAAACVAAGRAAACCLIPFSAMIFFKLVHGFAACHFNIKFTAGVHPQAVLGLECCLCV
jgi:hypothetical protein